jgi:exopolysaccharide biosynthesis polyprenyl glycosylphosphotransferase
MNAPLQHLPLDVRLNRPLAPPLERLRLRLCLSLMIVDGLAILASFLFAGVIYLGEFPSEIALREATLIAPMFLIFGFHGSFYKPELIFSIRNSLYNCIYSFAVSAMVFVLITFYSKITEEFSRVIFTLGCFLSVVTILSLRWLIRLWVRRVVGPSLQNTVIIHAGGPAIHMDHAYHVDANEHDLSPDANDPANLDRLGRYMQNMDRVIISCAHDDRALWAPLLRAAGVQGEFVSDALRKLGALKIQNEVGFSSVVVSTRPLGIEARVLKRLMDVSLSSFALLVLSPLMAVVALLIRLEDGGPVLFRQRRMGYGNRFFWIYKFRSMRTELGDADGSRSISREDDRTTTIGKLIRRTSIDELPQLFNVWRGDMSLVGPRPHALGSQAGEKLFWEIDGRYWNRHVLKPGVTGLAQVRGFRGATACEQDLADRLKADLEYISNWSLWLDVKILLKTLRVLIHDNAY